VRLPAGVFDDSVEAAEYLVRHPAVVVLVDGYNVSKTAWATAPLEEQRNRLTDALAELNARSGADVVAVFDGSDVERSATAAARAAVRVRFSPPGVEADDVILGLIDEYPPSRPVVVASSDRRVGDGARDRGANVLSARQLIAALRR
jgi:predicted RNA-binding protein with PIN domain